MKLTKVLIEFIYKTKPLLLKFIPIEHLRKVKSIFVSKSFNDMKKNKKEQFNRDKYIDGINLIGSIRAETGLGQSCRLIANQLKSTNIEFTINNYSPIAAIRTNDNSWNCKITEKSPYNINLIHINPHELGFAYMQLDMKKWDYRYNIAFWLWELEEFPDEWTNCFKFIDEIWTPSEFTSSSIRKKTTLPVKTIPYCVTAPYDEQYNRDYFKLPMDKFLFLTMYDSSSVMERKNPMGVINAFKKAFDKDNNKVGLVVKINNVQQSDIDIIKHTLEGYNNIYYITDVLEKVQVNSLIRNVDVFVSLHRAEGFGLVLAEAMILGTPTIATNWSSNTEFMNSDVSCLVDYKMKAIENNIGPFKKGAQWAEPNINQASLYMTKLYEDKKYYNIVASKAQDYINEKLSMERAVKLIENRLFKIYQEN